MQEDYITLESKHPDYHNYVIPEDWHRTYSRQNILVFLNCGCRRPDLLINGLDDSNLMGIFHVSLCSIDKYLVLLRTQFQCRSNFPKENTILAGEKRLFFPESQKTSQLEGSVGDNSIMDQSSESGLQEQNWFCEICFQNSDSLISIAVCTQCWKFLTISLNTSSYWRCRSLAMCQGPEFEVYINFEVNLCNLACMCLSKEDTMLPFPAHRDQ